MKKLLTGILTAVMVVGLAGSVYAADSAETKTKVRVKDLPGYSELIELRGEAKEFREQIKAERQQIKALKMQARQDKNKQVFTELKSLRPEVKQLHDELKVLRETQKSNWEAMRAAKQAGDQAQMESIMDDILATRGAINAKLEEVKEFGGQIIDILEGSANEPADDQLEDSV